MAALTGNSVGSSYQSLLKTADNAAIDANLKNMTDGLGNATPLSMGTNTIQLQADTIELIEPTGGTNLISISPTETYFEGNVNFTNATVTGIGGGTPGVEQGTGTHSIQTAAFLTADHPSVSSGFASLALGRNSDATSDSAIAIGNYTDSTGAKSIAIGSEISATNSRSITIGWNANNPASSGILIGTSTGTASAATNAVVIGRDSNV